MKKIILASNSPRRREILKSAGIDFEIIPSNYDEVLDTDNFSYETIENLAYNKAIDVANRTNNNSIIIGADTVVVLNNKILTKPKDREDAISIIKSLSNIEHKVVTAICIIDKYKEQVNIKTVTTKVHFSNLTEEMITYYVDNYKPYDKAGAYGIQELPPEYIKYVDGSLENVIGLCSKTVLKMIEN